MRTCGTSRGEESICFCDRSPFFGCEVELEVSCGFEKADQISLLYFIRIGNSAYYPCSVIPALLHNDRYGWVTFPMPGVILEQLRKFIIHLQEGESE